MPAISVTSLGNAEQIATADVSIRLVGTAESDSEIKAISWNNSRGGNGSAKGTEQWSTGPIILQIGLNTITITAEDTEGNRNTKEVKVDRELGPFAVPNDDSDPIVMYSYHGDLRNAAPLEGAQVEPGPLTVFLGRSEGWEAKGLGKVEYECCLSDARAEAAFGEPWRVLVDASSGQEGVDRELTVRGSFTDSSVEEQTLRFFLATADSTNEAPSITGEPSTAATVGIEYSFLPTGFDADSDTLAYSIKNKPDWATFDVLTGHLHGFPTSSDVGVDRNIEITVSDGRTSTSMKRFSITVDAITDNAVTLSWDAPTERESGAPLTNLAGFEIYYSPESGNLGNVARIENPGIFQHSVENLQPGRWKFVIVAYDAQGKYSEHSNQVATTIR